MILLGGLTRCTAPSSARSPSTALGEVAQLVTERKLLVEGLVILLVVMLLPKGLSGIALPRLALSRKSGYRSREQGMRGRGPPRWLSAPAIRRAPRTGLPAILRRAAWPCATSPRAAPGRAARRDRPERRRQVHACQSADRARSSRPPAARAEGRDVTGAPPWRMPRLGVGRSFQRTNILPSLTVLENVRLAVQAVGRPRARSCATPARETFLVEAAAPRLATGSGSARRPRIAGVLSARRAAPARDRHGARRASRRCCCSTSRWPAWAPRKSQRMTALLKDLAREHALLLIEHDMDFVFAVADWMTVMAEGTCWRPAGPRRSAPTRPCRTPISGATCDAAPPR